MMTLMAMEDPKSSSIDFVEQSSHRITPCPGFPLSYSVALLNELDAEVGMEILAVEHSHTLGSEKWFADCI